MRLNIYQNQLEKIANLLINSLEEAILPNYPALFELKNAISKSENCLNTIMSGSGPSIFGLLNTCNPIINFLLPENKDIFIVKAINHGIIEQK